RWLEQGINKRDERLLQRVVDEAFASTAGARALDLLGDLAFERGQFAEARTWWEMLAGPLRQREGQPRELQLVYPADSVPDLALVRSRLVMASLFLGEMEAFRAELDAFVALHPKAEGTLAGRKGTYAEILKALATDTNRLRLPEHAEAWPT